jgi:DnaK suppressor protein
MTHVLVPQEGSAGVPGPEGLGAGTDLAQLRADLMELRDFRLQQLADLDADLVRERGTALGDVAASLKVAGLAALREIDAALARMATNDGYGTCQQCGGQIPAERLKVLPMAAFCMPCQASREQECR